MDEQRKGCNKISLIEEANLESDGKGKRKNPWKNLSPISIRQPLIHMKWKKQTRDTRAGR